MIVYSLVKIITCTRSLSNSQKLDNYAPCYRYIHQIPYNIDMHIYRIVLGAFEHLEKLYNA